MHQHRHLPAPRTPHPVPRYFSPPAHIPHKKIVAASAAYLPEPRTPNPEISELCQKRHAEVRLIPEYRM